MSDEAKNDSESASRSALESGTSSDRVLIEQYSLLRDETVTRIEMRGRRVTRAFLAAISFLGVAFLSGGNGAVEGISSGIIVALSPLAFAFFYFEEMRSERILRRLGDQLNKMEEELSKGIESNPDILRWEDNYGGQANEDRRQKIAPATTLLSGLFGYCVLALLGLLALGWSEPWFSASAWHSVRTAFAFVYCVVLGVGVVTYWSVRNEPYYDSDGDGDGDSDGDGDGDSDGDGDGDSDGDGDGDGDTGTFVSACRS